MCEGASERQRTHATHACEKQTKRFAALSEHQHASTRLGVQCTNALVLYVWPDHACLSLGQEAALHGVHMEPVARRVRGWNPV